MYVFEDYDGMMIMFQVLRRDSLDTMMRRIQAVMTMDYVSLDRQPSAEGRLNRLQQNMRLVMMHMIQHSAFFWNLNSSW